MGKEFSEVKRAYLAGFLDADKASREKVWIPSAVVVKITQKDSRVLKLVREVLHNVSPYLQVKKRQADYAIEILEKSIESKQDLVFVAQLADALSRLNVRSENRRKNTAVTVQEGCLP